MDVDESNDDKGALVGKCKIKILLIKKQKKIIVINIPYTKTMQHMTEDFTDFGYQNVPRSQKIELVRDLFSNVSNRYDMMNDFMSFGTHRCWKKKFIHKLPLAHDQIILDVAAGTGDVSLLLHKTFPYLNLKTHLVDLTPSMLEEAKKKAIDAGILKHIYFHSSAAEEITFDDNTADLYLISFGLRNVADRTQTLKRAFEVLKPGGAFYCLEFSHVNNPLWRKLYDTYSFHVLPFLGDHVAKDKEAYLYLAQSIRRFPNADSLQNEMQTAGFIHVKYERWMGGIVAMHCGKKPL